MKNEYQLHGKEITHVTTEQIDDYRWEGITRDFNWYGETEEEVLEKIKRYYGADYVIR
jgi:hypothetical protein